MANQPIPTLPVAVSLDGTEQMELVQPAGSGGTSKRATTGQIAALATGLPTTVIPPISVIGNPTNSTATSTAILGAAGQVLVVNDTGTALDFGRLNLSNTASVTSILAVSNGGQGNSSLTAHGVIIGNGTSAVNVTTPGTAGQAFVGQTSTSDPQFVTIGGDLLLGAAGTATIVTAAVTYAKVQQVPGLSALGVAGNATAVIAPLTATAAYQVLQANAAGTGIGFGLLNITGSLTGTLDVPRGGTGDTSLTAHGVMVGNGTSAVSVTAAGSAGQVFVGQTTTSDPQFVTLAGDVVVTAAGTTTVTTNSISYAKIQQVAGLSVVGVAGTATANVNAITGSAAYQVLQVNSGGTGVGFGLLNITGSLTGTLDVPRGGTGDTTLTAHGVLIGNGTSAVTVTAAPSAAQVLVGQTTTSDPAFVSLAGDVTITASGTSTIGTNVVSYSKIQQVPGLSVVGVAGTATANVSAITGSSAYQVLQVNSGATGVTFGQINITGSLTGTLDVPRGGTGDTSLTAHGVLLGNGTAAISVSAAPSAGQVLVGQTTTSDPLFKTLVGDVTLSANATSTIGTNVVTYAKFQQVTGLSVVGVTGTATANAAAISGTASQFLQVNSAGTGLVFATATGDFTFSGQTATIATAAVTYAKIQQAAPLSVVGVTGNATATVAAISGTASQALVVNSAGTGLSFGAIDATATAAFTGNLRITQFNSATSASTATFWRGDGTWASPPSAGGWILIQTQTASASASIDFTTGINSTYDRYFVVISDLVPTIDNCDFYIRISKDAGVSWISTSTAYAWSRTAQWDANTTFFGSGNTATAQMTISAGLSNGTGRSYSSLGWFVRPFGTSYHKKFRFSASYESAVNVIVFDETSAAYILDTAAINGVQFLLSTGTIATGVISLYGLAK